MKDCKIYVAKRKVLTSRAVSAKLIYAFVLAYMKSKFDGLLIAWTLISE